MGSDEAESAFVRARHAAVRTPRSAVDALVRRAADAPPVALVRIVRGYDNEVYRARLESGREVVVRIARFQTDEAPGLRTEAWAMDLARRAGVPVPEVLLLDRVPSGDGDVPAMVLECVPGLPLDDVPPDHPRRWDAFAEAGVLLSRMHTIEVGGFWRPHEDGSWPIQDSAVLWSHFIENRSGERDLIRSAGFTTADVDHMIDQLDRHADDARHERPVLCHGDFTGDHIFVDDDLRVTGIIDFGELHGGASIGDLAHLRFKLPATELEAILTGYDPPDMNDPGFRQRLDRHALGLAMGYLAHEITIDDTAAARRSADTLAEILRRLRTSHPS